MSRVLSISIRKFIIFDSAVEALRRERVNNKQTHFRINNVSKNVVLRLHYAQFNHFSVFKYSTYLRSKVNKIHTYYQLLKQGFSDLFMSCMRVLIKKIH